MKDSGNFEISKKWYASKSVWKQVFISSAVWNFYFMTGMCVGAPTVFVPQIRREANSTDAVDEETASWLYSIFGVSSMPWILLLPSASRYIGLRIPFITSCFVMLLVFLILYFSTSINQLIFAEIMEGYVHACNIIISIAVISEYTSPKYRGMFLTIKSASFFWGIWLSNIIGTFFHWKYIAVFGMLCCCQTFTSILWPESPHWLASKGRFRDCKASYRWLHDRTEESERELRQLIESHTDYSKSRANGQGSYNFAQYTKREFYKPLFLMMTSVTQYHFSGKFVCSVYILDILRKITQSESTAYTGMLILDGVTLLGMYAGCVLTRFLSRRTMYLTSSMFGVLFLFLISTYLYLVRFTLIDENKYLSILLLTCFSISVGCGPMIMTTTIYGEIIPSKYKVTLHLAIGLLFHMYSTGLLKIAPWVFRSLGLHGIFLFYAIVTGMCTFLLYVYLPETKDKTLQEIEENFVGKDRLETAPSCEETDLFVAKRS
ncbi:unnamed protein product, partial [Iphiclides podalirius]